MSSRYATPLSAMLDVCTTKLWRTSWPSGQYIERSTQWTAILSQPCTLHTPWKHIREREREREREWENEWVSKSVWHSDLIGLSSRLSKSCRCSTAPSASNPLGQYHTCPVAVTRVQTSCCFPFPDSKLPMYYNRVPLNFNNAKLNRFR